MVGHAVAPMDASAGGQLLTTYQVQVWCLGEGGWSTYLNLTPLPLPPTSPNLSKAQARAEQREWLHASRRQQGLPPLQDASDHPTDRGHTPTASAPASHTTPASNTSASHTSAAHTLTAHTGGQPHTTTAAAVNTPGAGLSASHAIAAGARAWDGGGGGEGGCASLPSFLQPRALTFSPAALKELSLGLSVLGLTLQVREGGEGVHVGWLDEGREGGLKGGTRFEREGERAWRGE